MLRGWVHSGFNVHRARRVLSREREDMERARPIHHRTRIYAAHQRCWRTHALCQPDRHFRMDKKCLTSGPTFLTLRLHGNGRSRLPTPGRRREGQK
jgi:hypothetical protein